MKKKDKIAIATEDEVAQFAPAADGQPSADGAAQDDQARSGEPASKTQEPETIESLRRQIEEYKDKVLRAQAECANISKRLQQQHAESLKYAGMDLARALLPVVDSFQRTMQSLDAEASENDAVAQGVRLIAEQLDKVLREHGVEPIAAVGEPFDPKFHEAMMQDRQSDMPPGTVTMEMERGYKKHDRVLRPAKVAVAAASEGDSGENETAETTPKTSDEEEPETT